MTYSVAIRTLGTSPDTLRRELESIFKQTLPPEKVIIYIAKGYKRPDFTIGYEEYVYVDKGMVSQRALQYREIQSDCILLLDDDVELAPDSANILLSQLEDNQADCVAVDTFCNHKMTWHNKLKALLVGWVCPRFTQNWAFKLHSCGTFSYINNPRKGLYQSQSAAGPASLWRKSSFLAIKLEDELWLEQFSFPYGEDELYYYKLYLNGGRLFVSFNSGVKNLDGQTSSGAFHKNGKRYFIRSMANVCRWYRTRVQPHSSLHRLWAITTFSLRMLWLSLIHIALSVCTFSINPITYFFKGLIKGIQFLKSDQYRKIPPFKDATIKFNR